MCEAACCSWSGAWYETQTYGHQILWVSSHGIELQAGGTTEVREDIVRCYSDTVAIFLESLSESEERLHVA